MKKQFKTKKNRDNAKYFKKADHIAGNNIVLIIII